MNLWHCCADVASTVGGMKWGEGGVPASTNLQEDSDHSESVTLAGSISKAGILGVPVHQMQLRRGQRAMSSNKDTAALKPSTQTFLSSYRS